jgi:hypothetical protein
MHSYSAPRNCGRRRSLVRVPVSGVPSHADEPRNLVTTVDAFVTRFAPQFPEPIVLRNDQATFIPCCLKVAARSTAG